jgi:hypothetical protein
MKIVGESLGDGTSDSPDTYSLDKPKWQRRRRKKVLPTRKEAND